MKTSQAITSQVCTGEIEFEIQATAGAVWTALFRDIDQWWLDDFRILTTASQLTFDPNPSGTGLIEKYSESKLQWYSVQMYLPDVKQIYLVGYVGPNWGGPVTSMLSLEVQEAEAGCRFKLIDSRHGHVQPEHLKSTLEGWQSLFGEGLRKFVERS